jgi:hypothetical protein
MKHLALFAAILVGGLAFAQNDSHSEIEKKYQRFENGELVENEYYLERDGKRIAGRDFDMPEMDVKMAEMETRMNEMQQNMDVRMSDMKSRMDAKMKEIQLKQQQMQFKIQERMEEMQKRMQGMNSFSAPSSQLNVSNPDIFGA